MSSPDLSTSSSLDDSTITDVTLDKILLSISQGAEEATQSEDYLSYSTLLDITLNEALKLSYAERDTVLITLLDILKENRELTYEIGWDLPSILLTFIPLDYKFEISIKYGPNIYNVMKLFECLALYGNPKELLLKGVELLSSLKMSDYPSDNTSLQEMFFNLRLYCIFELVDSSLRRLKVLYPSRFLSMVIVTFLNLVSQNNTRSMSLFLTKRGYSFARNYAGPELPDNINETMTEEQIQTLKDDENYLQRKLLAGFVTNLTYLVMHDFCAAYFNNIVDFSKTGEMEYSKPGDIHVFDRLSELSLSFDIDLKQCFQTYIVDSHVLLRTLDYSNTPEDFNTKLFELMMNDNAKNNHDSLISSEGKSIQNSTTGCLILYTHWLFYRNEFKSYPITFKDAVAMSLRLLIPGIVNNKFRNMGKIDVCFFWIWHTVYNSDLSTMDLKSEIDSIPSVVIKVFYQVLLLYCISIGDHPECRFKLFTLLTKLLTLTKEDTGFEFLIDSLENCPYDNVQAAVVGVLKELLLKQRIELSSDINELVLSDNIKGPKIPTRKYINFSVTKEQILSGVIDKFVDSAFQNSEEGSASPGVRIKGNKVSTLLSYLNLLIAIKNDRDIHCSSSFISPIVEKVSQLILDTSNSLDSTDPQFDHKSNMLQLINIALERLKV